MTSGPGNRRRALRAAADRMRVSFFIGVALVPSLLTQLFTGIGGRVTWWQWSALLLLLIAGFGLYAYQADRRLQRALDRHLLGNPDMATPVRDLSLITDLVITVDLTASGPRNLHTLTPRLPNLRRIYGISGSFEGDHAAAESRLQRLVGETGASHVHVRLLASLPSFELNEDGSEQLRLKLEGLDHSRSDGEVIAADVTGGTVPMSLTTFRAAVAAGIPVVYTITPQPASPNQPREFSGLVALHDPDGVLTRGIRPLASITTEAS